MTVDHFFTTGDGCRISYRIDGPDDGPVLAFSNSISTDLHMWDRSVPSFGGSFRLLRYDTRGHGQSDAPAGGYSLDRLGRDVIELLDHLQIERVHFLGLSLGGVVAQWLGIYAPERLKHLILSNTSPYLADELPFDELIRRALATVDRSSIADEFLANWFPPSWLSGSNVEQPAQFVTEVKEFLSSDSPG
jgi:3-oxoadipate enol-lactonase